MNNWTPKSILLLRHYSRAAFLADLIAGVTVGLVALPLAMAFAISSGVLPQAGLYCAVITGFLISALGGSRFQIGGPTGAFVVVVAGIVAGVGASLTADPEAGGSIAGAVAGSTFRYWVRPDETGCILRSAVAMPSMREVFDNALC